VWLAIDPGIDTGWAVLNATGKLVACGKDQFPCLSIRAAIIERPQVYAPGKSKGNPNDLITLAIRVGRYQERLQQAGVHCPDTNLFLPTTWKGQVPKEIHHARVDAALSEDERRIAYASAKVPGSRGYSHDVWDAIGLARWGWNTRRFANLAG
jgi:hypothetical protein